MKHEFYIRQNTDGNNPPYKWSVYKRHEDGSSTWLSHHFKRDEARAEVRELKAKQKAAPELAKLLEYP